MFAATAAAVLLHRILSGHDDGTPQPTQPTLDAADGKPTLEVQVPAAHNTDPNRDSEGMVQETPATTAADHGHDGIVRLIATSIDSTPQPTQPATGTADGDGEDVGEATLEAQVPAAAATEVTEDLHTPDGGDGEEGAAAAIRSLLPPPRAVRYWWEGGNAATPAGEPQYDLAQEATRWLILAVQAAHLSRLIKQAGRRLMACHVFTCNLGFLRCWKQLLIPELKAPLVALGAKAKGINAASNIATILTTANVLATARYNLELFPAGAATPRNSIRQDTLMPSLAAAASTDYNRDWKAQPEHIYIHMLLLVATALNPLFGVALKTLASDMDGIELHDAPIKSFTRMLNKLMAADDHRYVEQKPRPAMNIDIVRMLASAATAADVLELVALVAARFGGLSHLKCLPELAATNPAAADARYHMLPVMVTVVFGPEGLTVGDSVFLLPVYIHHSTTITSTAATHLQQPLHSRNPRIQPCVQRGQT